MAYTAKLLIGDVLSIAPDKNLKDAAKKMRDAGVGSLIVGTPEKPQGIVTERDLVRRGLTAGSDPAKTAVCSVMTKKLVTVDASAPLDDVFELLSEGKFRHLPITENGRVVGIVSLTDLAKVLREVFHEDKYLQYFADVVQAR